MLDYVWLIVLFPLLGLLINAFFGYRLGRRLSGAMATVAVTLSFAVAAAVFAALLGLPADQRSVTQTLWQWIAAGDFHVEIGFLVDPLSAVMMLVVTGVGALIHLYSNGYMQEDSDYARYFTYLNLFIVGMLFLVLAGNFLLLYLGLEAVGLCSYLLIGFWYQRKSAADAGKKAFIVNRVGDFGFALGVMLIFVTFKTLDFNAVFSAAHSIGVTASAGAPAITAITLLLFMGAVGKSAQFPLHVWLPDAMEGPTPVSALIHAATMVTAGVYMIARAHTLFAAAPLTLTVVAVIGAGTAFFAATIALVQTDIKKVLAYSTISQLGYMFMAVGVGAYGAGIFHLTTHAFFKALLFLGAGAVIHALGGEQDMRRMGGLGGKLPWVAGTFIVAWLAIAGIPPLSGFFSKDEILSATYYAGHPILWLLGLATAALTAFYMSRAVFLTFFGRSHVSAEVEHHLHKPPLNMTLTLVALAVLAAVAGALLGSWTGGFERFLQPVFADTPLQTASAAHLPEAVLVSLSVLAGLIGIVVAWLTYIKGVVSAEKVAQDLAPLNRLLYNGYYVDRFYSAVFVRPLVSLAGWLAESVDRGVIDGAVNGVALVLGGLGRRLRSWQSGYVRRYALTVLIGVVVVTTVAIVMIRVA